MFPTDFPARSPIPSRLMKKSYSPILSHSINQMTSHLPVLFPSHGEQRGIFSHTVPREDPQKNCPRRARLSHLIPRGVVPLVCSSAILNQESHCIRTTYWYSCNKQGHAGCRRYRAVRDETTSSVAGGKKMGLAEGQHGKRFPFVYPGWEWDGKVGSHG